jgi:hypothetical protein
MLTIEIHPSFIQMTVLLFQEANYATVNINGQPFKHFEIQKALWQGCPFAPYYYYCYYYYYYQPHGQESTNQPKIK